MFSLSKLTMSLLRENMNISEFTKGVVNWNIFPRWGRIRRSLHNANLRFQFTPEK